MIHYHILLLIPLLDAYALNPEKVKVFLVSQGRKCMAKCYPWQAEGLAGFGFAWYF